MITAVPDLSVRQAVGRRLSATDHAMLFVDQGLRGMGFPGFETQMLVWLSGRTDVARLRTALGRLAHVHPLTTARLGEASGRPCWHFRPDEQCTLHECSVGDDNAAVLDQAAALLSTPCDPSETDPVRFHLLHRPSGADVFLIQYNHTLMDNHAALLLLREIERLAAGGNDAHESVSSRGDPIWEHLRRFRRGRRRRAVEKTLDLWGRTLHGRARLLGKTVAVPARSVRFHIAARSLSVEATRGLHERVIAQCGYPAISMGLVGSVFRALRPFPALHGTDRREFIAGIGIDLGTRGKQGPIFQNPISLVPVHAAAGELDDRDALVKMLSRQFRGILANDLDLGVLQLVGLYARRPRYARWVIEAMLRQGFSLWYAYFGAADVAGDSFCGAAIDNLFYTGPCWAPPGLTLLVNQFRGRLLMQATYLPDSVPQTVAEQFLDGLVDDLVR